MENREIEILGAGVAGSALAYALLRRDGDLRILLRDRRSQLRRMRTFERLPAAALESLATLGLEKEFRRARAGVAQAGHSEPLQPTTVEARGCDYRVDYGRLRAWLRAKALSTGASMELEAEESSSRSRGTFVVDATGRAAAWARHQGVAREQWERLVVIGTRVPLGDREIDLVSNGSPGPTSFHPHEDGWWSVVPREVYDPRHSAVVQDPSFVDILCFTDLRNMVRKRVSERQPWLKYLERSSLASLSPALEEKPFRLYRGFAGTHWLERSCAADWAAVGDAAGGADPLCGQGLVYAFEDAVEVSAMICALLSSGRDELGPRRLLSQREQVLAERRRRISQARRELVEDLGPVGASPFWQRWACPAGSRQAGALGSGQESRGIGGVFPAFEARLAPRRHSLRRSAQ